MKKAIIIGASSGIGRELAIEMSKRGYELGITARRLDMLQEVAKLCPNKTYIKTMDTLRYDEARSILEQLIAEMNGVDIVVYNAGVGSSQGDWHAEQQMHEINAVGFAAIARKAFDYFESNKKPGHIVGVSSIAGTRGMRQSIGYSASKAFMWNYMQGLQHKSIYEKLDISITDIRPGFVLTDMTKANKGMFWVQTADKAARQIADAIESKRQVAYITHRWTIVGWLLKMIPDFMWNRA